MGQEYKYLIPIVSVGPPGGYTLQQSLSLYQISRLLNRPEATLTIRRVLIRDGKELRTQDDKISLRNGEWTGTGANYAFEALPDDNWAAGRPLAYLETHITVEGEAGFTSHFAPPFYTVYTGPNRKTFFSDNALKYGNTVTIHQIQAFGAWVEGYPAVSVDPERDAAESLVLHNPFHGAATVGIYLDDRLAEPRRVRIEPLTGVRIDIGKLFELDGKSWKGQVFVSGRNRVVMYVAKHSASDPCNITTVEHSNPYRGEPTHEPVTRRVRREVGEWLQGL